jgi:hypothetical protein
VICWPLMWLLAVQAVQGPAAAPPSVAGESRFDVSVQAEMVADVLPRRDVAEMRPRLGIELTGTPSAWLAVKLDARAEGLLANRSGLVSGAYGEVRDAWVEVNHGVFDVRGGYGRLSWGRLDEIAPTDVINPIDASRFLFEGRAEARLPTAFVRARFRPAERVTIEGVLAPFFRPGVFDRLDDPTSPFNLVEEAVAAEPISIARGRREPAASWANVSGGGRADVTVGRVDVGLAAYRGFDGIGPLGIELQSAELLSLPVPVLVESHPRFTMIGGDFETVSGPWAWRGEVAYFPERSFSLAPEIGLADGRAMDAGIGFDRRAGDFRVFAAGIVHREWSSDLISFSRTDLSIVGSIERSFEREQYFARAFAVVNPGDAGAFVRGLLTWKPTDRWSVDLSGGAFAGTSDDTIGRFRTRDFVLASLRTWIW